MQGVYKVEKEEGSLDGVNWIRPDQPSRCTWELGLTMSESPHDHRKK